MKNMTKLSKIVAFLCAAVLFVTSVDFSAFASTEADAGITTDTVEEGIVEYEVLGVEDFTGQTEIIYTDESTNTKPSAGDQSLDGMMVDGIYQFSGYAALYIGAANWGGFRIGRKTNTDTMTYQFMNNAGAQSLHYKEITATDTDCTLFDADVRIKVGVSFVNTYEDTAIVDAKITLNIGEKYEDIFVLEGIQKSHLVGRMFAYPNGGSITMKAAKEQKLLDFSDFGIVEDYTVTEGVVTKSAGSGTLDGVTIDGTYYLSGYPSIQFGERDGMRLQIHVNGRKELVCQFLDSGQTSYVPTTGGTHTTTSLGCNYLNTDVRIKVGFTFENVDETAGTADITIHLQIGPTWTDTIQIDGATNIEKLTRTLVLIGSSSTGSSVTLKVPKPEGVEISPVDMGIADGIYGYQVAEDTEEVAYTVLGIEDFKNAEEYTLETGKQTTLSASTETLDGVVIDGIYRLSMNPVIDFGGTAWAGLQFQRTSAGAKFQFLNAVGTDVLGYVEFTNAETGGIYDTDVRIKVAFDFTSEISTSDTANATITITVGACVKSFDIVGAKTAYMKRAMFWYAPDAPITMKTTAERTASVSGELENLHTAATGTMTLNNKTFSADVQFDATNSELRVGGTDDNIWGGIRLKRINDSYFAFSNTFGMAETLISTEEVGLGSTNEKFNLKIDFEYVALDTDAIINDVKYGIWINDFLVDQTYLYSKDDADKFGVWALVYCPNEYGKVAISTEWHQRPDDNTPYILEDFGIEEQVYSVDNLSGRQYTKNLGAAVSGGSSITGKIALNGDASLTLYGAPDNEWFGFRFRIENGGLIIQHTESNVNAIRISVPEVTAGETFTFSVEQEVLDLDNDGLQDDIRFGVRINGTLYQEQRFYLLDFAGRSYTRALLYVGTGNADASWVDVKPSVDVEAYDLDDTENGYLVSGEGTVTVDNAEVTNGTVLDTPGDYIVRCAQEGAYVKRIALYRSGDAHADGESDVRDLVAAIKAQSNVRLETQAGRKAADVDKNNVVNQVDYENIRDGLIGIANTTTQSVYFTHEQDVMPIAGFYAPSRGTDAEGNAYDLITDDIYKLISDAGINLILSGNIDYRTKSQDVLDSLSLAEKYGLGMYVYDTRYNPDSAVLEAPALADYQKDFAGYSSYKGTFVIDEPFTVASGREEAGKMMSEYVYKTKMLNSYSNTLGYINIGPKSDYSSLSSLEDTYRENYTKHIDEILTPGEKLISWDYYVFDGITGTQAYASPKGYFANLSMMRERSMKEGSPFWAYIQAGSYWGNTVTENKSTPSEAELLWNVNTNLAYGVKGIQYFTLLQPTSFVSGSYEKNSLIDVNGNPTKWYGYAQTANKQIAAVDEYLLYANTLDVLAVGSTAQTHTGITKTSYGDLLTGVTADGGALVGVFDYQGKTALYVVNYDAYDAETTYDVLDQGDEAADEITLTFGSAQNYSIVSTQLAVEASSGSGTTCTLSLNNGGAALVILN